MLVDTGEDVLPADIFMTKANFSDYIEKQLLENPESNYFELVVAYSEESYQEIEDVVKLMSDVLLEKVKQSAVELGMIRCTSVDINEFSSEF